MDADKTNPEQQLLPLAERLQRLLSTSIADVRQEKLARVGELVRLKLSWLGEIRSLLIELRPDFKDNDTWLIAESDGPGHVRLGRINPVPR